MAANMSFVFVCLIFIHLVYSGLPFKSNKFNRQSKSTLRNYQTEFFNEVMLMHLLRLYEIVIRFTKLSRFFKTIGTVKWELLIQKQIRVCVFYYSLNFIMEWYKVCFTIYFSCYLWRQSNCCRKQKCKMQTASLCCRFRKNWRFQGKIIPQLIWNAIVIMN